MWMIWHFLATISKNWAIFFKSSGHPGYNFHTDLIVLPSSVLLGVVVLNVVMVGSVLMVVVLLSVILLSVV